MVATLARPCPDVGSTFPRGLDLDTFRIFTAWRADLARYRPTTTAQLYRRTAFAAFADLPHPREWTEALLRRYLEALTPASAKLVRQALMDFTSWAHRKGHLPSDPLEQVPARPTRAGRLPRGLEPEELVRVLEVIERRTPGRERWTETRHRLALMVRANYLTGLRPGEMCRLERANVILGDDQPRLEVWATKTQTERVVPLNDDAARAFAELCEGRDGRLFALRTTTYHEQLSRAAKIAGLAPEKCRPYALRHSFATQLIRAGVDIVQVGQLMGHSNIQTTRRYALADAARLRASVDLIRLPQHQDQAA